MPTPQTPRTPLDDARAAFDPLTTSDKTAFVLQATFETIGQALAETGRTLSDTINAMDVDAWFRPPGAAPTDPPPAPPTTPPPVPKRPKAA